MRYLLWNLLRRWTGALQAEQDFTTMTEVAEGYRARLERLEDLLRTADRVHASDEAQLAVAAGQRWAAVSALVGGVEQLQQQWLLRASGGAEAHEAISLRERLIRRQTVCGSWITKGTASSSSMSLNQLSVELAAEEIRRCVNELGGLKNSIRKQFGIHPSQAKKSAAELGFTGTLREALDNSYDPPRALSGKPALKDY